MKRVDKKSARAARILDTGNLGRVGGGVTLQPGDLEALVIAARETGT